MTTTNVTEHRALATVESRKSDLPGPLLRAANVAVTTAQKYELSTGCRLAMVSPTDGGVYAKSGVVGDSDITAGAGAYVAQGVVRPVFIEDGDTHLLMIAAS